MKKMFTIVSLFLFTLTSGAQTQQTSFNLRNYSKSLTVVINNQQSAKFYSDEYGKSIQVSNSVDISPRYLFHGQEYDEHLDLYFYPSRLYSTINRRFLQPDPKSQYHSPYIIVGSDPINYIDINGKAGKPLVLYNKVNTPSGMENAMLDIKAQVGDAYYYPISDVLSGKVGDLSELNGTVYIHTHTSPIAGGLFQTEAGNDPTEFAMSNRPNAMHLIENPHFKEGSPITRPKYSVSMNAHDFGEELRNLADAKGLTINNIVAGGCQSANAAKAVGRGFTAKPSSAGNAKLQTIGLDNELKAMVIGDNTLTSSGYAAAGETKLLTAPAEGFQQVFREDRSTSPPKMTEMWNLDPEDGELYGPAAEASGEELNNFVRDARVPGEFDHIYERFAFEY